MNVFTIKDLENLSGIKAHTIRIWEQRYSFLKPCRTETNIRYYCSEELKRVLHISLLNKYGYKISQINKMSEQELKNRIFSLSDAEALQEKLVNELIAHMIDLDTVSFERLLDGYVLGHGINRTISQIIFPFLHRIGLLWLTNHVHPAQEHLVSNIIRQKLIVGIEKAVPFRQASRTVLLFLPEGEHHELGLLYVHYLLRTHGAGVLYLGADMPLKDVTFVSKHKRPDYLYTHLTGITGSFNLEKFLSQVRQCIPDIPLVISGQLARNHLRPIPAGIHCKRSLPEVQEFIATL
ncbi:MerR family transcriptional regulator [Flavitalea sp. BT771]|uniref:MerR family transcriptional regulator n=1 Tax=Flavitalea sp. BT771 TaxID=3063329 RepID=UPI0026E31F03|nr:MerR family transcriptional regulator [Flavitalea sp. BT771]MDO6434135.1 MerR family transcriptional regulator [Flavitalea sp. BT771]MDV6223035.1 MerR family transcriptional regulator [Flavitalea sp. BT771]